MSYDLSTIGLKGIEAAQNTLNSIANRSALEVQTATAQHKLDDELQEESIAQRAMDAYNQLNILTPQQQQGQDQARDTLDQNAQTAFNRVVSGKPGDPSASASGFPEDPGARLEYLGNAYLRAGMTARGQEALKAAQDYRQGDASIEQTQLDSAKIRLENMHATANFVANHIGQNESEFRLFQQNLQNPPNQEWRQVRASIGERETEMLLEQQWTPDLQAYYASTALSIKDKAELALQSQSAQQRQREHADLQADRLMGRRLQQAQLDETRQYHARLSSNAGGRAAAVTPPSDNERGAIADVLRSSGIFSDAALDSGGNFADSGTSNSFNLMVLDVAGRVRQMLPNYPGKTYEQVAQIAIAEMQVSGDLVSHYRTYPDENNAVVPGSRTVEFKQPGSFNRPLELPAGSGDDFERALKPGNWYVTPGQTRPSYWNGKSFTRTSTPTQSRD